jgi:hypothetical protein
MEIGKRRQAQRLVHRKGSMNTLDDPGDHE